MSVQIPKATSFTAVFKAFLSSDHATEATGKTIAITISKAGGAFGNPNAGATNATEISSGWYKVTLDTTDTGTLGQLALRGAVATIDDVGIVYQVVNATNGGLTALPDTAVTTNASLLTSGTSTAQLSVSSGQVILQTGTGTGQLDFTSGVVKANATQILGTAVSTPATAGILDVNVKNMNNVAGTAITTIKAVQGLTTADTIATYTGNMPQTGDAYARLGAPAGASVSADVAAINVIDTAVKAKTDNLPASPAAVGSAMTLTNAYDFAKGTVAMTESYAANGVAPTPAQAMMAIHQMLMDFGISGTNITVKKLDNATTAFIVAIDSATTPTAASRT